MSFIKKYDQFMDSISIKYIPLLISVLISIVMPRMSVFMIPFILFWYLTRYFYKVHDNVESNNAEDVAMLLTFVSFVTTCVFFIIAIILFSQHYCNDYTEEIIFVNDIPKYIWQIF